MQRLGSGILHSNGSKERTKRATPGFFRRVLCLSMNRCAPIRHSNECYAGAGYQAAYRSSFESLARRSAITRDYAVAFTDPLPDPGSDTRKPPPKRRPESIGMPPLSEPHWAKAGLSLAKARPRCLARFFLGFSVSVSVSGLLWQFRDKNYLAPFRCRFSSSDSFQSTRSSRTCSCPPCGVV